MNDVTIISLLLANILFVIVPCPVDMCAELTSGSTSRVLERKPNVNGVRLFRVRVNVPDRVYMIQENSGLLDANYRIPVYPVGVSHRKPLSAREYRIGDENQETTNLKRALRFLPPAKFLFSALAGIAGIAWGWFGIDDKSKNLALCFCSIITGIILWAYGFAGTMLWIDRTWF